MKKLLVASFVLLGLYIYFIYRTKEVVSKDIVVDFADNVSQEHIDALENKLGVKFKAESDYTAVDKVYVAHYEGTDYEDFMKSIRDDSDVEAADVDGVMSIPENEVAVRLSNEEVKASKTFPNDPLYNLQWGMNQVHLNKAWNGKAGVGVVVAVLDTGINKAQDFQDTKFVDGYDFIDNHKEVYDGNSHGTHCAGTIAESTNNGLGAVGIAYKATLMPVKVLSDAGSGSIAGIIEGINFAVANGAKVISMSLGGGLYNAVMAKTIKNAHDKGVFIVAANGNSQRGEVSFPAAYPGVCAVAATQSNEKNSYFSNWGKETCISAPGGAGNKKYEDGIIQNTIKDGVDGYYSYNGTSMATPHVAGVAALIISEGITDPDMVRKILTETARVPNGVKGRTKEFQEHYGAGIVDADRAVAKAQSLAHPISSKLLYVFIVLVMLLAWLVFRKKR